MTTSDPLPRTAVPLDIADPVQAARAELKAALAAIEEKANVPRRVQKASGRAIRRARAYADRNPVGAVVGVVALASAAGIAVWGLARFLSR